MTKQSSLWDLADGVDDESSDDGDVEDELDTKQSYKDREPELKVRENRENITPLRCSSCNDGVSIPVKGVMPSGRELDPDACLYMCHHYFCKNSLWNHDGPIADGDMLKVQGEMTKVANTEGPAN